MAHKRITESEIMDFTVQLMKHDETANALSLVVSPLLQRMAKDAALFSIWNRIEELPEPFLDELAWELNIDWYDYGAPIEQKREAVKSSQQIHAKRGTKWAVERLLKIYFGEAILTEWFEYGGKPYYFKIETLNKDAITNENIRKFRDMLWKTKNVRSWVEKITQDLTVNMNLYQGLLTRDIGTDVCPVHSSREYDGGLHKEFHGFLFRDIGTDRIPMKQRIKEE